jgi:hypothetical protein
MRARVFLTAAATSAALLVVIGSPAASADTALLVSETFTGTATTSPNWVRPAASVATGNGVCLAAVPLASTSQTPVPGCAPGAAGVPGLQLTPSQTNREGGLAYSSSVPSSLGLDVKFDSFQYGATTTPGADGIVFFLAASDPNNASASPITLGPTGGFLGYAPHKAVGSAGLTRGYLGVGLDVFGNFTNTDADGTGCANPSTGVGAASVTVRGAGNGTAGYCQLVTTPVLRSNLESGAAESVPVEVAVNPTEGLLTSVGGLEVPPHSWMVRVQRLGATGAVVQSGPLPDATAFVDDPNWVDANGVPHQLSFGWSAATGANTDFHTISNVTVATLNGTPPELGVTLTSNGGGTARTGQTVTYTATASVSRMPETRPITLTDTFPNGLTPQAASGGGWDCTASSGQTVKCTHAPPAGLDALPVVSMPVTVAIPPGPSLLLADTVTVGSPDAVQGSATISDTYSPAPTATALSFTAQPVNAKLNTAMPSSVKVAALVTAGGAVDNSYTGSVSLTFANNPTAAQFVVGGLPTTTLTATAVAGVATFSSIMVNKVGFGYTLLASATGLSSATSTSFEVNTEQLTCPVGGCSVTTTSTTGVAGSVQGIAGATITASFGGTAAPIKPCTGSVQGILTFSGIGQKLITLTYPVTKAKPIPVLFVCYGQPTPFLDILFRQTTFRNPLNGNEYEGILPICLPRFTGPCVKSVTFTKTTEKIVIQSATGDPRVMG